MGKYKSRATRAGDAAGLLTDVAGELREAKTYDEARAALDKLDTGDVESLSEEMTSWRDNIEEKFSATQKFEEVSEAADALESIVDALQSLNDLTEPTLVAPGSLNATPGLPADPAKNPKDGEEGEVEDDEDDEDDTEDEVWKDDAVSIADEIENQASELEAVSFPGMY